MNLLCFGHEVESVCEETGSHLPKRRFGGGRQDRSRAINSFQEPLWSRRVNKSHPKSVSAGSLFMPVSLLMSIGPTSNGKSSAKWSHGNNVIITLEA